MANPMATAAPKAAGGNNAPVRLIPFTRGAFEHSEPFLDTTVTLGAGVINVGPTDIPAYGFFRAIEFDIQLVSAGNAATVALNEDAPWNVVNQISINDVNGSPLVGPLGGYDAYLFHKYGGFRAQRDPKLLSTYSAITVGAGATAGSGRYQFRVNIERNARDGVGSLANQNASQNYKLSLVISALSTIFSTSPTVAPTCRVRATLIAWSQPNAADQAGRPQATVPPGNMTTGFFTRTQPPTVAGANTIRHTRVGNYLRNLVYTNRRAGTTRSTGETDLAGVQWQWYLDSRLWQSLSTEQMRQRMYEAFNLTSVTAEAAGGFDNGVVVAPWNMSDLDGMAGFETRDQWMPTTQATRLELLFTLPNSGVLTIGTDDVAPNGNIFV